MKPCPFCATRQFDEIDRLCQEIVERDVRIHDLQSVDSAARAAHRALQELRAFNEHRVDPITLDAIQKDWDDSDRLQKAYYAAVDAMWATIGAFNP